MKLRPRKLPMELAQFYDATLTDCDSGLSVRVIVIPHRSMAPYVQGDLVAWASLLGLRSVALLDSESEMISVLASTLVPSNGEAAGLARVVVEEPRIPFSDGDIRLLSLAAIARTANVALSQVVSLVSAPEARLLLVAVPDGVAICGGAAGMAGALEAGLSSRIREVMGLDGRKFLSTGPAAHN